MKRATILAVFLVAAAAAAPARAIDFTFDGYADARFVLPPTDDSYLDGGLGKLRFGRDDGSPNLHLTEMVGEARALVTPEIMATATARIDPNYGPGIDLLESWVRYRPVSTTEWRWSVKAGAFFPPNSLENDEIGWTSFWTLTPSAINSWIGSEVRVIGTEGTLEWRRDEGTVTLIGAVFGWNDNAGDLMTDRGWNFDDRVTGLFGKVRVPDATAVLLHQTPPLHEQLFKEIDGAPGWYLDLSWEPEDIGGIEIMRYDNNADPAAKRGNDVAWHTSFWNLGLDKQLGKVTLLAQGMTGSTIIQPSPHFRLDTNFRSAYVLAGLDLDDWWFAGRFDVFQTRTFTPKVMPLLSEDGHAETLSASYLPAKWLRLTGELMVVDSNRPERKLTGDAPQQTEIQLQFSTRVYLGALGN
jgi:hypothetical protein